MLARPTWQALLQYPGVSFNVVTPANERFVGAFVGMYVSRITAQIISRCCWNSMLRLGYQWKESINFWWWSGRDTDSQHCRIGHFRRFISISRNSAKWLMPTREWIQYFLGAIRRTAGSDQSGNPDSNVRITFGHLRKSKFKRSGPLGVGGTVQCRNSYNVTTY